MGGIGYEKQNNGRVRVKLISNPELPVDNNVIEKATNDRTAIELLRRCKAILLNERFEGRRIIQEIEDYLNSRADL